MGTEDQTVAAQNKVDRFRSRSFNEYFKIPDNPSNYGRVPDFNPFGNGGLLSMDNPEYILQEERRRNASQPHRGSRGDYHTLGIPFHTASSPGGSQGPSSIHSVPNMPNNGHYGSINGPGMSHNGGNPYASGLNGVINSGNTRLGHPPGRGSSAGEDESDEHEYYNDFDRLKRELQPLHPTRTSTTSSSTGSVQSGLPPPPSSMGSMAPQKPIVLAPPPSKHETTV